MRIACRRIGRPGDAMSLLDEVRKFEHQVIERLKQLEPLIGEYNQLRRLAQRLGVSYTPPDPAAPATDVPGRKSAAKKSKPAGRAAAKPRRAPAKSAAKRASRTRAAAAGATQSAGPPSTAKKAVETVNPAKKRARRSPRRKATAARPGRRTEDVLRAVGEQPGISVREIGERLGVDATGLYRVANKLTAAGRLRKDGTRLYAVESGATA